LTSFLSSASLMSGATRGADTSEARKLHLGGDLVDRCSRSARGRARRGSGRRSWSALGGRLSTSSRLRWAAVMSPGTSNAFARLTSSSAARRSWLIWTCRPWVARAVGHALEERLAHRLVGVVDDAP
jgi:hypothetical protein